MTETAMERRRWTPEYALNVASATVIVMFLLFAPLASAFRIGIDPQPARCLPWTVFVVGQHVPDHLERNTLYSYISQGVAHIPDGTRVVKYVAAIAGDHVVVDASGIRINGHLWGGLNPDMMRRNRIDYLSIARDYIVPEGAAVVLGVTRVSYDSRYWGTINVSQIDGKAWAVL